MGHYDDGNGPNGWVYEGGSKWDRGAAGGEVTRNHWQGGL